MQEALQVLISGLAIGCVYSLIAIGFTMMLRATELINFAQGEMVMLGAFVAFTIATLVPLPFGVVFLLTTAILAVVGFLMERLIFRPILRARAPLLNLIIATVGLSFALKALAIVIWGGYPQAMPGIRGTDLVQIGPIAVPQVSLWVLGLGIAAMALLQWFFQRTMTGIAWRAVAFDPDTAQLMGVSVTRTVALTFAIASALGGAAGVLLAPLYFVSVNLGAIALKSFAGSALGGFGIVGTMIGGVFLGLLETVATGYLSSAYKDVIAFGLIIAILLFFYRPKVPAGRSAEERSRSVGRLEIPHLGEVVARFRLPIGVLALVVWLGFPQVVTDAYSLRVINQALVMLIGALGLQMIIGYTGQFSLGHAAFMGVGAYTSVLLTMNLGVPWLLAAAIGMLASALLGLAVSPILRLPGHYLAMATLALGQIVVMLLINLEGITRGAYGISNIPSAQIGPIVFGSHGRFFYLASAMAILVYLVLRRVIHSRVGRALLAIRENELGAVTAGIDLNGYRARAFVIGCACAGLSGALYAPYLSLISPAAFTLEQSIDFLIMVVIGGLGSIPGAVLGALTVTLAPEYLRFLGPWRLVVYGVTLILFMTYLPGGLLDLLRQPARRLVGWQPLLRLLERLAAVPRPAMDPAMPGGAGSAPQ